MCTFCDIWLTCGDFAHTNDSKYYRTWCGFSEMARLLVLSGSAEYGARWYGFGSWRWRACDWKLGLISKRSAETGHFCCCCCFPMATESQRRWRTNWTEPVSHRRPPERETDGSWVPAESGTYRAKCLFTKRTLKMHDLKMADKEKPGIERVQACTR